MNADVFFVFGLVIAMFSLPSLIGAVLDRRLPTVAIIVGAVGVGMVIFAQTAFSGSYGFADIPEAFVRVVGRFLN